MTCNGEIIVIRETPPGVEKQVNEIIIERGAGAGPEGPEGPAGPAGGIDYDSPTAINTTATITPVNNKYYTSTSKLVTLTGSGSEKFKPGTETSRIIWGTGAGVEGTVTIDPSNLSAGDIFEIALSGGESRVLMFDGTDFIKIGGVERPQRFIVRRSTDQAGLTSGTFNDVALDQVSVDNASIFSSPDVTIQRDAEWSFFARYATSASAGSTSRVQCRLNVDGAEEDIFGDDWPNSGIGVGNFRNTGSMLRKTSKGESIGMAIFSLISGGASWSILGNSISDYEGTYLGGEEVVPW
jgi:hypothetical protein